MNNEIKGDNRQKHQKGSLLHFIYQIGAVLQLFTWGSVFLLQSAPQEGASMEHATRGTVRRTRQRQGSDPDAGTSGSALPLGATGSAQRVGATGSAPDAGTTQTPMYFLNIF